MSEEATKDARELYLVMRSFWQHFGHRMNTILTRGGINTPQYMAMVALAKLGESTMGELSKVLRVTMGASTNIADKLVRGRFVTRSRGKTDRRVVLVRLEQKGYDTLKGLEDSAVGFLSEILGRMESGRRTDFIGSYEEMMNHALESDADAATGNPDAG